MSGSKTTEDSIINGIPGLDDFMASSDTNAQVQTTTQSNEATADTNTQSSTSTGAGSGTDSTGTGAVAQPATKAEATATVGEDGQVIPRKDGLAEKPNAENPRTRDLVDPQTGRVVARGGIERHIFEQAQRHRRENDTLKQQMTTLQTQVQQASEPVRIATQLGLQPQQQVAAMQAMADFLRDPERMIQTLIEEVRGRGFALEFLNNGITPQMDLRAVGRMIDTKMAPLTQVDQQRQQEQQAMQQAEQELNAFINDVPDAIPHLQILGRMVTQNPGMTLDRAYTRFVQWTVSNGIDHLQPIGPQLEALQAHPSQQATAAPQPQQQPQQQQTAPLPNGRVANQATVREAATVVNEGTSWRDIVRASMQENGYQLQ